MVEKTDSRECHCDIVLVAGIDNIVITDRSTRLCNVFYAALVCAFDIVAEWEECVRTKAKRLCSYRAMRAFLLR